MTEDKGTRWPKMGRATLTRGRPSFLTRTATDEAGELRRRSSVPAEISSMVDNYGSISANKTGRRPSSFTDGANETQALLQRSGSDKRDRQAERRVTDLEEGMSTTSEKAVPVGSDTKPDGLQGKLGTFSGVFVPTSLNVLSILMFIRFGFILGQTGLLGMLALLVAAYIINVFTTLSISAVASNGTVRGGGAYYLISRSLGAEFGGSIGLVSYCGFVLNTGMNAVGLVDCLIYNFGADSGIWSNWLPEAGWYPYLWSTCVVVFCVMICLAGSALFSRASNFLLCILMLATLSIPLSVLVVNPFKRPEHLRQYTHFTGPKLETIRENLLPSFTKGAAGSQTRGRETWADMFGILFPATGGIFAGASMSGDLKSPGKSIPSGTLYGVLLTFLTYSLVIVAMACSITRSTFYRNVNVIQDVNISEILVLLGEIATTSFSVLMGIIGPAKQFQAIAKDGIFPGLGIFSTGTAKSGDPINAIILTWLMAQLTILLDINSIASIVTMSYLLMNFSLHLACLLLKISSAPNFRPSFRYFNIWTALLGAIISIGSMFFVDAVAASLSIALLMAIFIVIHYTTPPKAWGADVTSGLVYHQVRKYLLRLKTDSVKYWRPQILLFVNDTRRGLKLIKFANNLKKGGLLVFGHVIVTDDFGGSVPETKKQRQAWNEFIDLLKIKAFINVVVSPSMEWGVRNLFLSAGLGGMRPNIVMMGFFNLTQFREEQPLIDIPEPPPERPGGARHRKKSQSQANGALPTDTCVVEKRTDLQSYVLSLEDLVLKLKVNVAVATGFSDLELPEKDGEEITKKYIDLWPIQMSARIPGEGLDQQPITTVNFDTYTLILQLGCILNTVRNWRKAYKLRVAVFVEYEYEFEDEKARVIQLLSDLRIKAEVLVFYLASGDVKSYNYIVSGEDDDEECNQRVQSVLEDEEWWKELQEFRDRVRSGDIAATDALSLAEDSGWVSSSLNERRESLDVRNGGLKRLLERTSRRQSLANLSTLGVVPTMRTQSIDPDVMSRRAQRDSDDSQASESDSGNDYLDDEYEEEYEDEDRETGSNSFAHSFDEDDANFADEDRPTSSNSKGVSSSKKSSKRSSRKSSKRNSRAASPQPDNSSTRAQQPNDSSYDESPIPRGRHIIRDRQDTGSMDALPADSPSTSAPLRRLQASSPKFSASPIPEPQTRDGETGGPSIMFADMPHPRHQSSNTQLAFDAATSSGPAQRSIYARSGNVEQSRSPTRSFATGTSAGSAVPISFNNLPCRAQHLILNELIGKHSEDAAVIFTTLPAPSEGTWRSEADSLSYLTDLEVLTQGLGPVLMVHSNSMTVTTNL